MQKTSYSAGTGGTIAPAPAVNALLVHRRLQLKHRVSTGVAAQAAESQIHQGHVATSRTGRTGTSLVCNHKQHAREEPTRLGNATGHVQGPTHPAGHRTPCGSNPSPRVSPQQAPEHFHCLATQWLHQFLDCSHLFHLHCWCWQ